MPDNNNDTLAEATLLKRKEQFNNLYDKYSPLMFGYICSIIKERDAGEEVLEKVFIQMWDEFNTREDFTERWFARLVRMANAQISETELKLQWFNDFKTFRSS